MQNAHDAALRHALLRIGAPDASIADADVPLPSLLQTPAIALLWTALLVVAVALLGLGRIRVPHVARGVVVATGAEPDSGAFTLLLPVTARRHVHVGHTALVDLGGATPVALEVTAVEPALLDIAAARRRFRAAAGLIANLETPKVAARVVPCGQGGCLTPAAGAVYPASVSLGTRSIASYAWSGAPPPTR